jgi:hypothetical protein
VAVRFSGAQSLKRTASLPDDELFTICGWARLSVDRNDYSCLVSLDDASSNWYLIETDVDGTTLTLVNPVGSPQTIATLTVGTDFFWALSASGLGLDNAAYYRAAGSNALSTVATGVNRSAFTPTALFIGNDGFGEAWNGLVWDVKCWNRLLTPQELLRQSYSFKPLDRTAINFWYPLQRHDVVNDYSGNGRDPTVTGTLTSESPTSFVLPRRRPRVIKAASGSGVTLALSGQSLAAASGTMVPSASVPLAGSVLASASGTLTASLSAPLAGSALTWSLGSLAVARSAALTGSSLTGALGTAAPSLSLALAGSGLTSALGTLLPARTLAIAGLQLTFGQGTVSAGGNVTLALTGQALTAVTGSLLPALSVRLSGSVESILSGTLTASGSVVTQSFPTPVARQIIVQGDRRVAVQPSSQPTTIPGSQRKIIIH